MPRLSHIFLIVLCMAAPTLRGEVILQYFNLGWKDLAEKMPEIVEAGYDALWLPPPTKASSVFSVGYDLWDPFDLGQKDQRGTVRTRYGTQADLNFLIETAHRFGVRVYFDNIMNHRAFDVPGFNENTPIDIYPGMVPEDFHLRVTEEGFFRKWDNTRNWNDAWQVQHLGLADLIDIAHETPNANFGPSEGSTHPKITYLRHPENPDYYCYTPGANGTSHAAGDGDYVGFGPDNGITTEFLQNNAWFYQEDVGAMLIRAVRWKMDVTKADGLRLDAVKHVPSYFFGLQGGPDADSSNLGYIGGVQQQFNLTRGFSDWNNHRDSNFNADIPRDDALVFGEHLGAPPGYQEYIDAGMRLLDAPLHREMNNRLGNPSSGLGGLDTPGWSGNPAFNDATGISFAQSHDDDFANRRELQHAYYLTRRGIANIYTDGYFKAETLGESGGAFPRHANNPFLGQFGDNRLPNLLKINEHFARGEQIPRWSDQDVVAYERRDRRENFAMSEADGTVMLFMMNDNFAEGQARPIGTTWPATPGGADTYLYNYSSYGGGFYVWASEIASGNVIIPPGGYFAFSWKNPDPSNLWPEENPISIYQNNQATDTVRVTRRDGPDGDPEFNPYNLPNRGYPNGVTPEPFTYQTTLPRITNGEDLRFVLRTDGSTENVQFKLNGGVDINSHLGLGPQTGDLRDNPPAIATDTFLGYEQASFVLRQHPEKFAAADSTRNQIGSLGAETYIVPAGGSQPSIVNGPTDANADFNSFGGNVAAFIYHDPASLVGGDDINEPGVGDPQFSDNGSTITVWAKTNSVGDGFKMFFYYTTDGSNPEGAGGEGRASTLSAPMTYQHNDDAGLNDWWGSTTIPKPPAGSELRYKIGIFRDNDFGEPINSVFPSDPGAVDYKANMLTVFDIANFDATNVEYYLHNDYGETQIGLSEGWHVLRARAYLDRAGRSSIYQTFTQPFYYDASPPSGEIVFPGGDGDTVSGQQYGFVVRTDATVSEVWYHIEDSDASNNDIQTGTLNGIGAGFEPFTDINRNGLRDPGEPFTDVNVNGVWDDNIGDSWVRATRVAPTPQVNSDFPIEWRFNYNLIPASGSATVRVRLMEVSSTPRSAWTPSMSDSEGHFTTLTRQINTAGPDVRLFVAWPQQDGDEVSPDYILKAYFTKSLADGLNEEQIIDNFTLRIQSDQSASAVGGVAQSRDDYSIIFDETPDFHALAFSLPNLFNNDPNFLHGISVELERDGQNTLRTERLVRAFPTPPPPRVDIINPLEIGSDGRPIEIILPELAAPDPSDREFVVRVQTSADIDSIDLLFDFAPENFQGNLTLRPNTPAAPNPIEQNSSKFYDFIWSDIVPGNYRFIANVSRDGETNSTRRNTTVRFRQLTSLDDSGDSDNDGITDSLENTNQALPSTNPENWTNGEVHLWVLSGRTSPIQPVSDGGALPDGLQLGLIGPINPAATDLTADTSGDGFTNFLPDLDPPVFNTTDNSSFPRFDLQRARTDLIAGSMTDPVRADSDEDRLLDHQEDLNRNGRVDIGILGSNGKVESILTHPNIPTFYNTSRVDRQALPANAVFLETDPNNSDTIGDGLLDGQSDSNRNGRVDIVLLNQDGSEVELDYTNPSSPHFRYNLLPNSNDLIDWDNQNPPSWHQPGTVYQPIRSRAVDYTTLLNDYQADGSGAQQDANGWPKLLIKETDPLRLDTIGDGLPDGWKLRNGLDPLDDGVYNWRTGEPGNPDNLPSADLTGDGVTNLDHFNAGTNPRSVITPGLPPTASIIIGPGRLLGSINGVDYFEEFKDWTFDDLIALDEYEGDGNNNQGGDLFPAFDGFDSSRDMVAFYARDGGDSLVGGDDTVYFRVDFDNLQPFAEEGFLNIYVVVNHNPGLGERVLPDDVDTLTDMRWRTVLAVYNSTTGRAYVDTDPNNNTNNFGENLFSGKGVEVYDQDHPNGFRGAYFNSELDAVEFAFSRQALLDGGWLGNDFEQLNFQVFTTKDGTSNSPPGAGDIGGRSDLRDTIFDDRVVENNFFSQAGREDILQSWFSPANRPAGNQRAKVILLAEGNQHFGRGNEMQDRINDNNGAGYHRLALTHQLFEAPLTLSITPALASAIQWAATDPESPRPWRNGPSFNLALRQLAEQGLLFLPTTTFAGHLPKYATTDFNAANINAGREIIEAIYNISPSPELFYPQERALDSNTFSELRNLNFSHTFVDQREHIENWFGRTEALGNNGFRVNRINQVNSLPISDDLSSFIFQNSDNGAPLQIRRILNRKARSFEQQQVVTLLTSMDDFSQLSRADAYQRTIRWLANRPWIEIITPEQIFQRNWFAVDRGENSLPTRAKNFIQYATDGSYDNWYFGSARHEGLASKVFERAPGSPLSQPFGRIGDSGLANLAWQQLSPLDATTGLGRLATATAGSALFTTAFHNQSNVDLRKFSTGEFINPASSQENLASFAGISQAHFRHAAIYARVHQWSQTAESLTGTSISNEDLTLDGNDNFLLFNSHVFAVFDQLGGRMLASWVRNPSSGRVFQTSGNLMAYADNPNDLEGTTNPTARRTSGFKDWFAANNASTDYVNQPYSISPSTNGDGWVFTSNDGKITKTITLPDTQARLIAHYQLHQDIPELFVRFGISPDLNQLMISGQSQLVGPQDDGARVRIANQGPDHTVAVYLNYQIGNFTANWSPNATDDPSNTFDTVPMRNQSMTQQLEVSGSQQFSFALEFESFASEFLDSDNDGLPDYWEELYFGHPTATSPDLDSDGDGLSNLEEFLLGTNPLTPDVYQVLLGSQISELDPSPTLQFQTLENRRYDIFFSDDLNSWQKATEIIGTGLLESWTDDGTTTPSHPNLTNKRFYRIQVSPITP